MSARVKPGYQPRLFTREEYWKLVEWNFFLNQKVELIGGEVVTMAAQGNLHSLGIDLLHDALVPVFGVGYWVRSQGSLDLSPLSVPDPDIAVVVGSRASYRGRREVPTTAFLVMEVSDTTLTDDRDRKGSLYAAAGIADYWILNIPEQQIEVRRVPQADEEQEFGCGYASFQTFRTGECVSPLLVPGGLIAVADVLPN